MTDEHIIGRTVTVDSYSVPNYRVSNKPHPGFLFARGELAACQFGDGAAVSAVPDELVVAGQADSLDGDGRQSFLEERLAVRWKDPRFVRRQRHLQLGWLGSWNLHKCAEKLNACDSGSSLRSYALPKGRVEFAFPEEDGVGWPELARRAGAPLAQIEKAVAMTDRGLPAKAKRQAFCSIIGARYECLSFEPGRKSGHKFFRRYGCKNRYCEACGPVIFKGLFAKYAGLRDVVANLVPHWPCRGRQPGRVVAKVDFTSRNLGRMPTRDEVRSFNLAIKKFWRLVERRFDLRRDAYGCAWCDEFGHGNSNLHAHAVYAGPWLPNRGPHKNELAELWREATSRTVFAGSFIVSVKPAKSFEAGLAHALKYAGKFLSKDPERLAELEEVFHRVKRVHTVAAFFKALPGKDSAREAQGELACPLCGAALARMPFSMSFVSVLEAQGYRDLEQAQRESGKERALSGGRRASPI